MYYKERTEFDSLSFSSVSAVGDDLLDEFHRSAEIDRREGPVRPTASPWGRYLEFGLGITRHCIIR